MCFFFKKKKAVKLIIKVIRNDISWFVLLILWHIYLRPWFILRLLTPRLHPGHVPLHLLRK